MECRYTQILFVFSVAQQSGEAIALMSAEIRNSHEKHIYALCQILGVTENQNSQDCLLL